MLQQGMVAFVCKLSKTVLLSSVNLLPKIINLFLLFDVVPTKVKVARIIPAHKSGDCNHPIFLENLLEKAVYTQIVNEY